MPTERLKYLIALYFNNTINDSQQYELSQWVSNHASDEELIKLLEQAWNEHKVNASMPDIESDRIISAILNPATQQTEEFPDKKVISINSNFLWLKRLVAAASILLVFSIGYFILRPSVRPVSVAGNTSSDKNGNAANDKNNDVKPGGQK